MINKTESMRSMHSMNKDLYQVNVTKVEKFNKKLNKLKENLDCLTHYTVKGTTIESNFYLKIEISIQRIIGGDYKEFKHFPILIRSKKLDLTQYSEYPQDPGIYYFFYLNWSLKIELFKNAIQLPGANLVIPNPI